jgi:amino acid adenylation domain-containing protein
MKAGVPPAPAMRTTPGTQTILPDLLAHATASRGNHVAVEDLPDGAITYAGLSALSGRICAHLRALGVRRGDRVGVYMAKSIDAVASILGVLEAGAAYVPIDADSPAWRAAYILHDCSVRAVLMERRLEPALRDELERLGAMPPVVGLERVGGGRGVDDALPSASPAPPERPEPISPDDLAYILYTSGSTGKPKGVMLTHRNALTFVEWCVRTFQPGPDDRFSSHAPFHFDLSILDLYVPMRVGATVVLIDSAAGKEPVGLAALIADRRLTVWYSTPSILSMLAQYGKMQRHDYAALHTVLFAGEVFPIKHLRSVKGLLPHAAFYNLYGPTETNVCTWYRVPDAIAEERTEPYPIGRVCDHLRGRIVGVDGEDVADGEGELCIAGPGVMAGYWNLPEHTARAFLVDADGTRWYRTGDIVLPDAAGDLLFVGRRDRMVKRRGYRIELGEIEAGLYRHPAVREAAVVATAGPEGTIITAFLSCRTEAVPSLIEMKRFCAETLPASMIPDRFAFRDSLPKTSTDKVDYQGLVAQL